MLGRVWFRDVFLSLTLRSGGVLGTVEWQC